MISYKLFSIDSYIDSKLGLITKEKFSWFYEPDFVNNVFIFREFNIKFRYIGK